ncbi:MAG: NAD-glutamate dehydrogenase [Propioniciclava sp.]
MSDDTADEAVAIPGLLESWLGPHGLDASFIDGSLSRRLLGLQARLGSARRAHTDLLQVISPTESTHGWNCGGATVVQVVTDDRPFLVDTVTMALVDAEWTLRTVHHPVLRVVRDPDGRLQRVAGDGESIGERESWLTVVASPPLGRAAAELRPLLAERLRAGLEASRVTHADAGAIGWHFAEVIDLVRGSGAADADESAALLEWVAAGNLELLAYRRYHVDGHAFTVVPGTGLGLLRGDVVDAFAAEPRPGVRGSVVIARDSRVSPVHRPRYLDYVGVRVRDAAGRVVGEHRFLGLWSARALAAPVENIPVVTQLVGRVQTTLGVLPQTHDAQVFAEAVAAVPLEEWLQRDEGVLTELTRRIAAVLELRRTTLIHNPGPYARFWTCLVFVPRDRYRTSVREAIVTILSQRLGAEAVDFRAVVSEAALSRLVIVLKRPDDTPAPPVDWGEIEAEVIRATRTWDDDFNDVAADLPAEMRGVEFGTAYRAEMTPRQALADLRLANELDGSGDLRFALYRPEDPDDPAGLRFKIITGAAMPLTQLIPHLSALGVRVTDERPFEWDLRGRPVVVYDLGLALPAGASADTWQPADRERFGEAFAASWRGDTYPGDLNHLVMSAGLTWEQVSWLRGMARYLQQAGIPYSQTYVAAALNAQPQLAAALVRAFTTRFDPEQQDDGAGERFVEVLAEIEVAVDAVTSLDQDRILRMFVALLRVMVRTNAFADDRPALAFKLAAADLSLLPQPRPPVEVFVISPRLQGVHLRFGSVARGGLRWSDRREDVRTEVLGLVRAQRVKNTVIIPMGAKGGFVPLRLPDPAADRAAWLAEGAACYDLFVSSLLSITDNLVDGRVIGAPGVVRHDGEDTYLVVAADKGTATFSDRANSIATRRGYWLGDAFASGGSVGYDHKAMGITARGAWASVRRHFYERGVDIGSEEITCVGIGDMAGDVFGNGMLLSEHLRLVGAFNHAHIFLDPDPDPAVSFAERRRLADLPRSSWDDYDRSLISSGGGVWPRTAKAIPVGPEVSRVLGLDDGITALTPTDLIRALLSAPVDLLWNGGIGTYVRGSEETSAEVGDKGNDAVRISGSQVRAHVAGEGGNLGWTEAGRVEYALAGGRINTDFIDNSAGVDTSDHEVNIKILLAPAVADGRLLPDDRRTLLASMTDEVAGLVLAHNVDQNIALSLEQAIVGSMMSAHEAWMRRLDESGVLDRDLAGLPDSATMARRTSEGVLLTRPELATLLSWTKLAMERTVLHSSLPDDPYLRDRLTSYFPRPLREAYAEDMVHHRLAREIVTTVTVNRFVNSAGITAYYRLAEETSATIEEIIRAQLAIRTILEVAQDEMSLPGLGLDATTEIALRAASRLMVERAARWMLTHHRGTFDVTAEAEALRVPVKDLRGDLPGLVTPRMRARAETTAAGLVAAGVPEALAMRAGLAPLLHLVLPIAGLAGESGRPLMLVGRLFFLIAERVGLDRVLERVEELPRSDPWDTIARAALRDDLITVQTGLTRTALTQPGSTAADVLSAWEAGLGGIDREAAEIGTITAADSTLARMSVAVRTLRSLLV